MQIRQLDYSDHTVGTTHSPLCVIADSIQSPVNIGSLFRLCDAFGVSHLYLTGSSVTPPNSKLNRVARSTQKCVVHSYHSHAVELIQSLKSEQFQILSLEITSNSIELSDYPFQPDQKMVLILGSEKHGIHTDLLAHSDAILYIDMLGVNSSMNVSCAAAIAIHTIVKSTYTIAKRSA